MAKFVFLALALVAGLITPVFADDWVALKLRGKVLELVDGAWQPVGRGDAVPETHVVRTLGNARVLFQRGSETIELGPDTQVQIFQRARDKFTTVKQYFGEVTVEADVEKVRHFAVETPHLVAVVKGTIFTVRSDDKSASVEVKRGAVAVESETDHSHVTVRAGQSASTDDGGTLEVSGNGTLPVVVDDKGKAVETGDDKSNNGKSDDNQGKGSSGSKGNGNSGNGNSGSGNSGSGSGNSGSNGSGSSGSGSGGSGNSGHGGGDDDEGDDD